MHHLLINGSSKMIRLLIIEIIIDLLYVCQTSMSRVYNSDLNFDIDVMCFVALSVLSILQDFHFVTVCMCVLKQCFILLYCTTMLHCVLWLLGNNRKMMTAFFAFEPLITVCSVHTSFFSIYLYSSLSIVLSLVYSILID